MKTHRPGRLAVLAWVAAGALSSLLPPAFAQGPLAPAGPPAPTMKSLDQIEPRTPISSTPFIITQPGSYYFTTNLYAASGYGVEIYANNVTVDLNGFALTGNSASDGIYCGAQTNFIVRNGSISGWDYGVYVGFTSSRNVLLESLAVSSCTNIGIQTSGPALVRNCFCVSNGIAGISLLGGQILDCDGSDNQGYGIDVQNGLVRNCRAANNGKFGIYVLSGTVTGCWVQNNAASGIFVGGAGSQVIGNTCMGNNTSAGTTDAGIYVYNSNNRIEDNQVSGSGYAGISVSGNFSGNIVVKNSVSGNGPNNYITPGNQVAGPLITTLGTITNANPWANFSF